MVVAEGRDNRRAGLPPYLAQKLRPPVLAGSKQLRVESGGPAWRGRRRWCRLTFGGMAPRPPQILGKGLRGTIAQLKNRHAARPPAATKGLAH